MKENEWISVEDSLPKLGEYVSIKNNEGQEYHNIKFLEENFRDSDFPGYYIGFRFAIFHFKVSHWRPIPEKRPDFSKLNEGDLIIIEFKDKGKIIRFYSKIYHENSLISTWLNANNKFAGSTDFDLDKIKKITRINLETHTFEEI